MNGRRADVEPQPGAEPDMERPAGLLDPVVGTKRHAGIRSDSHLAEPPSPEPRKGTIAGANPVHSPGVEHEPEALPSFDPNGQHRQLPGPGAGKVGEDIPSGKLHDTIP